jgi:hypothetical protein
MRISLSVGSAIAVAAVLVWRGFADFAALFFLEDVDLARRAGFSSAFATPSFASVFVFFGTMLIA